VTEQYIVWALVVGIAIGAALYWFAFGRVPRRTDDLAAPERVAEAALISHTIEARGGVAPVDLVEEVLDLHASYLSGPALDAESVATTSDDDVLAAPASQPRGGPQGN
jgi:HAMP domain-containing protein